MSVVSTFINKVTQQEDINFLITNRIPRRYATIFMGWFSKIEFLPVKYLSLKIWKLFASELDLSEAKKSSFKSMHDCFIRELKPGARLIDQRDEVIVSPCDAMVGAFGYVKNTRLFQTKGFPYTLNDLLTDDKLIERYKNGLYITLRLKSTMYHRFHAPYSGSVSEVTYISGDTWNVNTVALKRVEKLFCKNERAVIDLLPDGIDAHITLIPVAAILVASMKFNFIPETLNLRYKGPNRITCNAGFKKGDEMGYFQHGSTIIMFVSENLRFCNNIKEGLQLKMGQALFIK